MIKVKSYFILFMLLWGTHAVADMVYVEPTDPNKTGEWVWQYTDRDGNTQQIHNPVKIDRWKYIYDKGTQQVYFICCPTNYGTKIDRSPLLSRYSNPPGTNIYRYKTYWDFFTKQICYFWKDPNHITTGYDINDLHGFVKCYTPNLRPIANPVFNRSTSSIFHLGTCSYAEQKETMTKMSYEEAIAKGLRGCPVCNPYADPNDLKDPTCYYPDDPIVEKLPKVWIKDGDSYYHLDNPPSPSDPNTPMEGYEKVNILKALLKGRASCPICKTDENL